MNGKKKLLALFITLTVILLVSKFEVHADVCDDIPSNPDRIREKIKCLEGKTAELAIQSRTLSNQIAQFNSQIYLTELKIQQTQDQIALLGGRIDQLETSLQALSSAFSSRAVATYKMARSGEPFFLLIISGNLTQIIERFHYLQRAQVGDHDLLVRLQGAQNIYKENKVDQEKLQQLLDSQKKQLAIQKVAKGQLLAVTQSDEKKYQQLLNSARRQQQAFNSFVDSQGGASILSGQTFHSDWGYYYNQRDSEWGNFWINNSNECTDDNGNKIPCTMARFGCLVTSVSMIASHYGKNVKPGDIALNSSVFFGSTAYLLYNQPDTVGIVVNGARVERINIGATTASIDSELAAGRPVIVGIYNGPAHFVVIKSKSDGDYIMNDPFVEGGHDIRFTSKYPLSAITDVERVNVY